jgi:uncharacterized protein (TIGR03067 family)
MLHKRLGLAALVCVGAWCGSAAAWDRGERTDNAETTFASQLQGTWILVSVGGNGMKIDVPQGQAAVYIFKGDKFIADQGMRHDEGSYKLNETKMPKELDIIHLQGKDNQTIKFIYQLEGDTLKIAFGGQGGPNGPRPTGFDGKDVAIAIFKRKN